MVGIKDFTTAAINSNDMIFIVYISFFPSFDLNDHPFYRAQIALVIQDKALIVILSKYTDFVDIFSPNLAAKLSEQIRINNHFINLV